jgi:hypothetical protein
VATELLKVVVRNLGALECPGGSRLCVLHGRL